jgi:hypothetical protein
MSQAEVMQYIKKPTQTTPVFPRPTLEPSPMTTKWQAEEPFASQKGTGSHPFIIEKIVHL